MTLKPEDYARIKGGKWADETIAGLADESEAYRVGFWRRIKKVCYTTIEPPPKRPLRDAEAKAFGRTIVQFGQHAGQRVDDVPLEYWEWLVGENEKIQQYLASRRTQVEIAAFHR